MNGNRAAWTATAAGFCALVAALGIGRFGYTALLPAMRAEGLSDAAAGMVAAANLFGYMVASWAAGRTPAAWWRRGLVVALAVSAISTLGMAQIGFWPWLLWRAVGGVASAAAMVLAVGLMLESLAVTGHTDRTGYAFCGTGVGIALSGLVALGVADAAAAWLWLGGLAALAALPALIPAFATTPLAAPQVAAERRRDPAANVLALAYVLEGLGYSVAGTFLVAVVARAGGIALAGWSWCLAGLAAIPAYVIWRAVSLRFGIWQALGLAHLIQAAAIALPALSGSAPAALLSALGFGGTFLAISALTVAEGRRLGGIPEIGRLTAIFGVGQALGPLIAGWIAERQGSFALPLLLAAACVLAGGVVLYAHILRRK